MFLQHLAVCYRRSLFDRCDGFDATLRSCEDYDLYLRMGLLCRFEPIHRPMGLRRRHATNISRQTGRSRMAEAEVLRRFIEQHGGSHVVDVPTIRRRLSRVYYASARCFLREGRYRDAALAAVVCALLPPHAQEHGRATPGRLPETVGPARRGESAGIIRRTTC